MKLGDIKIEALKLMFVNYNIDIDIEGIDSYLQDENYASYLVNMPGAINRCFANIEERGVLPSKSYTLKAEEGLASASFIRFNLPSLIEDFFAVERIVYESGDDYDGDHDYRMEGDTLVLEHFDDKSETFIVLYKPRIERVLATTDNETEIEIPDNIAVHIPYFIKGDLYRDDEPNEASEARNWYEAAMEGITSKSDNKIGKVKSNYKQTV